MVCQASINNYIEDQYNNIYVQHKLATARCLQVQLHAFDSPALISGASSQVTHMQIARKPKGSKQANPRMILTAVPSQTHHKVALGRPLSPMNESINVVGCSLKRICVSVRAHVTISQTRTLALDISPTFGWVYKIVSPRNLRTNHLASESAAAEAWRVPSALELQAEDPPTMDICKCSPSPLQYLWDCNPGDSIDVNILKMQQVICYDMLCASDGKKGKGPKMCRCKRTLFS